MDEISATQHSVFLNRIHVMLTVLEILHHTAIIIGGDGGWYLRYAASSTLAKALLTLLCSVDQSFFLGAFFFLACYFTPRSFENKGWQRFSIDKLMRLGLPILVCGFLIGPLCFAYALLIFSAAYALLRTLMGQRM
jgi:hypothetical protein